MTDFIDTSLNTDFLIVDKSKLVITITGVTESGSPDSADNDKKRNQDDWFLEEASSVGTGS